MSASDSRQVARLELLAVVTTVLGVGSLFAASQLDRLARDGRLPRVSIAFNTATDQAATLLSLPRPSGPGLPSRGQSGPDTTASIPAHFTQPIVLDPCTGVRK